MVAALAIVAGAQAITGVIGGVIARAAARARAQYFSELQMEQARAANYWTKRAIATKAGADISSVASRGVAVTGSPVDMILSDNFNEQIKRTIQMQDARIRAAQTRIGGATAGSNALQQGFGTALNAGYNYAQGARDHSAARETGPVEMTT